MGIPAGADPTTDGIVQGSSQVYPNAIFNYQSLDPSSHTGQIDGARSAQDLQKVLIERLQVQPR